MTGGEAQSGAVRTHRVLALVVAHEGAEWLPRTLAALGSQSRRADAVVGIDAGSTDDSALLLEGAVQTVVCVGAREGLAAALHAGVAAADPGRAWGDGGGGWYWIVHDDSAPEPDCLAELLAAADRDPDAAVLIPKSVGWTDPTLLVGVGHHWASGKPVVEGVDAGEPDQGQHDFEVPVYSGDSACMLVRADMWAALDGFDAHAGTWAGAADLCRRVWGSGSRVVFAPGAVTAHRRAGHWGLRISARGRQHPRRAARRGQLYLDLTQAPALALAWRILRAWVSTAVRVVALLLTREPEEWAAELRGSWDVLGHPGRIRLGRRRARRAPVADLTRPAHLRAHRGWVMSRAFDGWRSTMVTAWRPRGRRGLSVGAGRVLLMAAVLALAAVARSPGSLVGSGQIRGGGLLPAPGAMGLLGDYLDSWHDVRLGSPAPQPTYLAVLAGLSAPVLGSVDLVLRLALTFAVPLAFLSCYASIRRDLAEPYRTSLALGYSTLPAGVAAAGAGRISTLALLLLGPGAARLAWEAVRSARDPGAGIRPAVAAGCLLGITASFAPLVLVLAAAIAAAGWARLRFAPWPVRS
ncbi:MAG: glycosyltransferase, partial [Candidatus Nanopelagicales bacterium]